MRRRVLGPAVAAALVAAGPAAAAFTDQAASRGSAARAAAAFAPRAAAPPSITGYAREGETLAASSGSWSPDAEHVERQWLRCGVDGAGCVPIDGATAATYTPTAADVDAPLRVRAVARNAGGSAEARSEATTAIRRSYASVVMLDRPSSYLRLDNNRTARVGAHAVAYGTTSFAAGGPLAGTGANFTARFGAPSALGVDAAAVANAGTVELWFEGNVGVLLGTQNGTPFATGASGYAPMIYIDTAGNLRAGRADSSHRVRLVSTGKRVTDGAWHHVAVTTSGATFRVYLDGVHVGSVTGSGGWSVYSGATLGSGLTESNAWPSTGSTQQHWQHFSGAIDEFATYPAALSEGQIRAHIAAATTR